MQHKPLKRFGQNFLQNQAIINEIIQAFHLNFEDSVIEIGPGLGALTKPLLKKLKNLTVIEIDNNLIPKLLEIAADKLTIVNQDALTLNFDQFGNNLRIVGNLPYNISTPIIFHLLHFIFFIEDMHFMLQKEVVERIASLPGSKKYGRMSVMVQYFCEVEQLFDIEPHCFYPVPKVNSSLIRITPYKLNHPFPKVSFKMLESVVAHAFAMRRKTLENNLKKLINSATLIDLNIDPKQRPEQISVAEYATIANFLSK